MKAFLKHIKDVVQHKTTIDKRRSGEWPRVRKEFLEKNPVCSLCGGKENLEVHHVKPFHLHPSFELKKSNLITLCESSANGINCHLAFGHLGNFKSFNVNAKKDASTWSLKIKKRP